jgi:colanic acid biosynthesis glycosyl transferase WcaI
MKILFLSDNFPPEVNAAASRVYERAVYWVKWGHDVTVITCAPNFPQGKVYSGYTNKWRHTEIIDGIKVIRVKTFIAKNEGFILRSLDFISYMIMAVINGAFLKRPDVVVSTSPQFFTAVAGHVLGAIKRRPFVFEIGDLWPESIRAVGALKNEKVYRAIEKLELYLYKKSKLVVAQTPAFKQNLVNRGIDESKIHVIMNAVDTKMYEPQEKCQEKLNDFNLTSDDFVVGYVGTHGMAHDLQTILKCAGILKDNNAVKFLFVGEGAAKKSLLEYREEHSLDNVHFNSAVKKNEMPSVWSVCDVILIPLVNKETFSTVVPSKLFEAMAMGKMIILMAPDGEASSILSRYDCGIHIPSEDATILSNTLDEILNSPAKISEYEKKALQASKHFSREDQARKFIDLLSSI